MPNGDNTGGPNFNKIHAFIWACILVFFVFLFWVFDKEAGWGLWPF